MGFVYIVRKKYKKKENLYIKTASRRCHLLRTLMCPMSIREREGVVYVHFRVNVSVVKP
jgi:hypothetical protein